MPRDGSGNYTLPVGNPVATGTLIQTTWANTTMNDIATQLNNVLTRDGVLGPVSAFKLVDGNTAAPGLAFASEPGLGWYRSGTSKIAIAAVNAIVEEGNFNTAAATYRQYYPRSAGESSLRLDRSPFGTANTSYFKLAQNATEARLESIAVGSGVMLPAIHQFSSHKFQISDANVYSQLSRPTADAVRLTLNKHTTAGSYVDIQSQRNGLLRWVLNLGDSAAESGSNAGSHFSIARYSDAGALLNNPMTILRDTGYINLNARNFYLKDATGASTLFNADMVTGGNGTVNITGNMVVGNGPFGNTTATFNNIVYGNNRFEFPVGFSGYLLMRGAGPISWNSFTTFGSARLLALFDSSVGGAGFGATITSDLYHDPGVSLACRVIVSGAVFNMNNAGQGSSTGGWVATSDSRVKHNKVKITNALTKVLTLNGYTYDKMDCLDMDGNPLRKAGYIAQDVQAVLPEAITIAPDEMGTLSVDHNAVIGLLIEALKDTNARIDQIAA